MLSNALIVEAFRMGRDCTLVCAWVQQLPAAKLQAIVIVHATTLMAVIGQWVAAPVHQVCVQRYLKITVLPMAASGRRRIVSVRLLHVILWQCRTIILFAKLIRVAVIIARLPVTTTETQWSSSAMMGMKFLPTVQQVASAVLQGDGLANLKIVFRLITAKMVRTIATRVMGQLVSSLERTLTRACVPKISKR
jgi:hypothetical protein